MRLVRLIVVKNAVILVIAVKKKYFAAFFTEIHHEIHRISLQKCTESNFVAKLCKKFGKWGKCGETI